VQRQFLFDFTKKQFLVINIVRSYAKIWAFSSCSSGKRNTFHSRFYSLLSMDTPRILAEQNSSLRRSDMVRKLPLTIRRCLFEWRSTNHKNIKKVLGCQE